MSTAVQAESASIVHEKYPHNGVVHQGDGQYGGTYEHQMPGGRIALVNWMYAGRNGKRRTIVVFEKNRPDSPVFTEHWVFHAAQASHATVKMIDKLVVT